MSSPTFSDYALVVTASDHQLAQPQSSMLTDEAGNLLVNYVGKIETIEADWAEIRRRLGVDVRLPRSNRSVADDDRTVTPEAADAISRHYARDYELFGFKPPS